MCVSPMKIKICILGVASSHAEEVLQEKLNVAYKRNEHLTEVCHRSEHQI